MSAWEKITNAIPTTTTKFGGEFLNRLSDYLNNVDLGLINVLFRPVINTITYFRHQKLYFIGRDGTNTIGIDTPTLSTSVLYTLPANEETVDDLASRQGTQTFRRKTLDGVTCIVQDGALSSNIPRKNTANVMTMLQSFDKGYDIRTQTPTNTAPTNYIRLECEDIGNNTYALYAHQRVNNSVIKVRVL